MKKNILIFPCGSEVGLEIYKSLNVSTHFNLYGGSSSEDHGKFVYKNYINNIPYVDHEDFPNKLNEIINKFNIDFIFPAHDSVVVKLAEENAKGNLNCEIVTSPVATCKLTRSKLDTYRFFKTLISVPELFSDITHIKPTDLPIFMKPNIGQGSKGTHLAKSPEEVIFYLQQNPSLLMLEYLPGKEYTVDCFTSKSGKLLFCEGRERKRILNGISVNSTTVEDDRFISLANIINQHLQFRGVWFFQVKKNNNGELVLMEIAPRVAGAMGLVRNKGVNLVLLSLFDAMGKDVSIFENQYNITIDRALENKYQHDIEYKHVYLDFDDLVIFEDKINPSIMAFVYQCINKNIKIHLLTKPKEDLTATLKKYRLTDTFDEILWIKDNDYKYLYIKEKDAIFVDDSYAERQKVHEKCGIPVFDAHMIESLMDKF